MHTCFVSLSCRFIRIKIYEKQQKEKIKQFSITETRRYTPESNDWEHFVKISIQCKHSFRFEKKKESFPNRQSFAKKISLRNGASIFQANTVPITLVPTRARSPISVANRKWTREWSILRKRQRRVPKESTFDDRNI